METNIKNNNKIQLALSSIMFFSPLIKKILQQVTINTQDKQFINLYIKYGNINLIILALILISGIISYLLENDSFYLAYQISLRTLTGLVIIETLFIIKTLLNNKLQLSGKE